MSFEHISLFLDLLVLVFLGATIYVAMRLSKSLNTFRQGRKQMADMLDRLGRHIDQANAAIINLRATSAKSAEQLKDLLEESRELSQELQIMTESAGKTAQRLEHSITRSRSASPRPARETAAVPTEPFAIRDREFDEGPAASPEQWEDDDMTIPENLQSKAEQDLYKALLGRRKRTASGSH